MKKNWQEQEIRNAKDFNGKRTPRSGGFWNMKGDVKSDKFLIENKITVKENFTIQGKVWEKIKHEALMEGRVPFLSIEFGKKKHEVLVIDKDDFIEIWKKLREL